MSVLCFGTFFTLLCGNKKDWDKKKKPEVSNRILYFALLDIIDKQNNPNHNVDKAKSGSVSGFKDDVPSDAKNCKRDDHPIQRDGSRAKYIERFENDHHSVLTDFMVYINVYLDEQQLKRLALSILELIINCNVVESYALYIGDSSTEKFTKKVIAEDKRDYNLPGLLAGVMYYIIKENIPNGSSDAQTTVDGWKTTYLKAPYCPIGESLGEDYGIRLMCDVPPISLTENSFDNENDKTTIQDDNTHSHNCVRLPVVILYGKDGKARKPVIVQDNKSLLIGRSPNSCDLLIADDSKVSTIHCAVRYDSINSVFFIIDMNSTNGTYLIDGTRLQGKSEYPLTPNSQFKISTSILSVGFIDEEANVIDAITPEIPTMIECTESKAPYDSEYFNLFVIGHYDPNDLYFDKGRIIIQPDRVLCEYISEDVKSQFGALDEVAIKRIKTFPSIFTCENNLCDYPGQKAYFGYVVDIKMRDNGLNVYFRLDNELSQQSLNDIAINLAVQKFEFSRTHWTIKNVDLTEELRAAGLIGEKTRVNNIYMNQNGNGNLQIGNFTGGTFTVNMGNSTAK